MHAAAMATLVGAAFEKLICDSENVIGSQNRIVLYWR